MVFEGFVGDEDGDVGRDGVHTTSWDDDGTGLGSVVVEPILFGCERSM